jgi:hypothetical protein
MLANARQVVTEGTPSAGQRIHFTAWLTKCLYPCNSRTGGSQKIKNEATYTWVFECFKGQHCSQYYMKYWFLPHRKSPHIYHEVNSVNNVKESLSIAAYWN